MWGLIMGTIRRLQPYNLPPELIPFGITIYVILPINCEANSITLRTRNELAQELGITRSYMANRGME